MSRYELRMLLSSWGLLVDLGLSVHLAGAKPSGGIDVAPRVWLVVDPSADVWEGDLPHLLTGLRRVAPKFRAGFSAQDRELVFVLDHLWYPLTDSQDGAIELAVAGWAVEELDLPDEPAAVTFDRAENRYVIEFDEQMWKTES